MGGPGTSDDTCESAATGGPGTALSRAVLSSRPGSLEDVLDLLAGLLGVARGLVLVTLGLQVGVVGRPARRLLALPGDFLGLVLHLVDAAHPVPPRLGGEEQGPGSRRAGQGGGGPGDRRPQPGGRG